MNSFTKVVGGRIFVLSVFSDLLLIGEKVRRPLVLAALFKSV